MENSAQQVLQLKYRPRTFSEVVGQPAVVRVLKAALETNKAHAVVLSGPSGTGKTTLARIAAYSVGCPEHDIIEVDAATYTGVDAMREIQTTLQFKPLGKSKARVIIVDEAHALSKAAWQSLLKIVEEPPPHVYWFFCSTEIDKIPVTIKNRCLCLSLSEVGPDALAVLSKRVLMGEKIKLAPDLEGLAIREARGSPRQFLVNLSIVQTAGSYKEAAALLKTALDSDPVLELCRLVVGGGSWGKAMAIFDKMEEVNPEGVRIVVCNYVAAALRKTTTNDKAAFLLGILDNFSVPYNQSEKLAPLMLSVGRCLLGE